MDELPAPLAPRLVRKSAHGRTQLFLPSASTVLREVKCLGGVTRHDTANVYHVLPNAYDQTPGAAMACWHCCEEIADPKATGIPLPRVYDSTERLYHVYGITCSPGCAKAYVLEHTTFDRGQHLNVLVKMLHDVYGVTGAVTEAPPRPAMRRFGGVFDPRQQTRASCRLVTPPFVSYCMLVEERLGGGAHVVGELPQQPPRTEEEEADTFDEPLPPALYDAYLQERRQDEGEEDHVARPPRQHSRRSPPSTRTAKRARDVEAAGPSGAAAMGPLARFVKPK